MLGNPLVGSAAAIISYTNSQAEITYTKPIADIVLEYNSKNKEFGREATEPVTLTETIAISNVFNRTYADSVTVAESIVIAAQFNLEIADTLSASDTFSWSYAKNLTETITTGDTPGIGDIHKVNPSDSISVSDARTMWHDGMLNTNMINTRLIAVGSTETQEDDVNIT